MINSEKLIAEIAEISQKIKSKEMPAVTPHEKQASIIMMTMEKVIMTLIQENIQTKIIFLSLFYFWFVLEASLCGFTDEIDPMAIMLPETIDRMILVIKSTLALLPDQPQNSDLETLGEKINQIKSMIPDEYLDTEIPQTELVEKTTVTNTLIHTVTSKFLTESFHPEIVANVLFLNWVRLSTIRANIPEQVHQKIEYYFDVVIKAVREDIQQLFV